MAAVALALTLALAAQPSAFAGAATDIPQLQHTSWGAIRGAPADIWAIAQGKDGYLWLGTGSGLYRFDGVSFEPAQLSNGQPFPTSNITALKMAANGDLWIGYYQGGLSVLRAGHLIDFPLGPHMPQGWITAIAIQPDGVVWAASQAGLLRYENGAWSLAGESLGFEPGAAGWVLLDPDGTLWATGEGRLMFLRKHARRFETTTVESRGTSLLARSPDGTLWLSDKAVGTRALPGLTTRHPTAPPARALVSDRIMADRLMFDRRGWLWGTDPQTHHLTFLLTTPANDADGEYLTLKRITERFDAATGMTSSAMTPLFQDSEGSVWIGTNQGLDSLRQSSVFVIPDMTTAQRLIEQMSFSNGVAYRAAGTQVYRIDDSRLVPYVTVPDEVYPIYADPAGTLWTGGRSAIWRYADGHLARFAYPAFMGSEDLHKMTTDGKDGVWVSTAGSGLQHLTGKGWQQPVPGSSPDGAVVLDTSDDGRVWAGYVGGALMSFNGTGSNLDVKHYTTCVRLIASISVKGDDLFAGGDSGMVMKEGKTLTCLRALGSMPLVGVTGIARSSNEIWLNTSKGVIRIAEGDLRRAFHDPAYRADFRVFDYRDGLPGVALQPVGPTAGVADNGKIWFETSLGFAWIDPNKVHSNTVVPHVFIRSVGTDAEVLPAVDGLRLPALTTRVHMVFTATSLAVPERARFRYFLEGVDTQWQDAGNRREAFYTNMGPGRYRFKVIAANDDGIWNRQGASLAFAIAPAWYQTIWFAVVLMVAFALLLVGLVRLRVRRHGEQVRERLEARHAERTRIARELHDTLLQSIHALVLRFQSATDSLPSEAPSRLLLENALTLADLVIAEGRDRVGELRLPELEEGDLGNALRGAGRELSELYGTTFVATQRGLARPLDPAIVREIFAITHEALINAFRHAEAGTIECVTQFTRSALTIIVVDDGTGRDPGASESSGSTRHFGITGMRERAERIGARFELSFRFGKGTTVDVRIPARRAYLRRGWTHNRSTATGSELS
jgi:signal transduction histidine kinase/sugar lactone lactonase YvrE